MDRSMAIPSSAIACSAKEVSEACKFPRAVRCSEGIDFLSGIWRYTSAIFIIEYIGLFHWIRIGPCQSSTTDLHDDLVPGFVRDLVVGIIY